jgi:hypothetical protein
MNAWLVVGLGLGTVLVLAHLRHPAKTDGPNLASASRLLLAGVTTVTAVKLTYLALVTDDVALEPFGGEDRVFIVLGSLVLMWVAVEDGRRELTRPSPQLSQ